MRARASAGAIAVLVLSALLAAGCRSQPVRDARIVENPSVVTIVGWRGTKGGGGTGFFVAPGQVVTCRHVVAGRGDVFVRLADSRQVTVRGVLAESAEHDLILLAVDPVRGAPPLALTDEEPRAGDALTAIGSPELRAQTVARMDATGEETTEAGFGQVFHVRGRMGPGASGCPLLDERDRVAGVLAGIQAYGSEFFVVPARFARALAPGPLRAMADWGAKTAADPAYQANEAFNEAGQDFWRKEHAKCLRQCERLLPTVLGMPGYARAVCDMIGRALVAMGRPDDAVRRLREIVAEHPTDAWSHRELGMLLKRLERHEDSLGPFREASRLDPKDAHAHAQVSATYMRLGRPAEAESEARISLALKPGWPWALHAVGATLTEQGKNAEALPFLEEAARLSPRNASAHADVGLVRMTLGRTEAIAAFETAVGLDPSNVIAHANLALCYARLGDRASSQRELAALRTLDAKAAAEVEQRLAAPPPAK